MVAPAQHPRNRNQYPTREQAGPRRTSDHAPYMPRDNEPLTQPIAIPREASDVRTRAPKDNESHTLARGIAIGAVGLAALGIATYEAVDIFGSSPAPSHEAGSGSIDYTDANIDQIPNMEFNGLPYSIQIDKTARYFNTAFDNGAVSTYLSDNTDANGYAMKGSVGTGSINDLPQEKTNRMTVKVSVARHLAASDLNLADNLVSGIYKPGSASYSAEITELQKIHDGNEPNPTPTTDTTFSSSTIFTEGSFAGIKAGGLPTQVFVTGEGSTGRMFDSVVQEQKSSVDPSVTEVIVVDEIGTGLPGDNFVDNFDGWAPSN